MIKLKLLSAVASVALAAAACAGTTSSPSPSAPASEAPSTAASASPEASPSASPYTVGGIAVPADTVGTVSDAVKQACSASAGATIKRIVDSGTLRAATGIAAPWGFRSSTTNQLVGFEPQTAQQLAETLGVKLEIKDYDYSLLVAGLQSGEFDLVAAGLFVTPTRQQAIDFSNTVTKSGQLFYTLQSKTDLNTVADLNKSSITFVYGTGNAQGDLAKQLIPNAKIIDAPLQGQNLLYEYLTSGRADVTMSDSLLNPIFIKKYQDLKVIGAKGVVTAEFPSEDEVLQPFDVAYGVAKNQPDFLACINSYVDWLKSSGTFDARFLYWENAAIAEH